MFRNRQCTGHAAVVGFLLKEMLQPPHQSHRVNRNRLNLALVYLGMPLASTLSQSYGYSATDNVLASGRSSDVRFSNRPLGVKHFQTIHVCGVGVAHGLVLLFGIGTKALPVWD